MGALLRGKTLAAGLAEVAAAGFVVSWEGETQTDIRRLRTLHIGAGNSQTNGLTKLSIIDWKKSPPFNKHFIQRGSRASPRPRRLLQLHLRLVGDFNHAQGLQGRADQGGPLHARRQRQGQDERREAAEDLGGAARGQGGRGSMALKN